MPVPLGVVAAQRTVTAAPGPPTTGMAGWWDASDTATITASGGEVSQWNDKSPNANHLTRTPGVANPTTGTATRNGRNVLVFDGSDFLAYVGATINVGSVTVFAVAVDVADGGNRAVFEIPPPSGNDYDSPNSCHLNNGDTSTWITLERMGQCGLNGSGPTPFGVYTAAFSPDGKKEVWGNGVAGSVSTSGAGFGVGGGYLMGARYYYGVIQTDGRWSGQIAEVIVYNRVVTTPERLQVESYLKTKWGTP